LHRRTRPRDHAYKEAITLNAKPSDDDRARALAEIAGDYPGWETWRGILAGVVYARRPNSSPPMVVRSVTPEGLREAIETAEKERGLR
jgi:hypothetical protein